MHAASNSNRSHCTEGCFTFTTHAQKRMACRGLRAQAVAAALDYGRVVHIRGADIYALGRKEVAFYAREGINLAPYEGVQVVVSCDAHILTVYRNRRFNGLRARGCTWRRAVAA